MDGDGWISRVLASDDSLCLSLSSSLYSFTKNKNSLTIMSLRTSLFRSARALTAAPRASSSRLAAAPRFACGYASDENSQSSSKAKDRAAVGVSVVSS